jgi:hypothetical protein
MDPQEVSRINTDTQAEAQVENIEELVPPEDPQSDFSHLFLESPASNRGTPLHLPGSVATFLLATGVPLFHLNSAIFPPKSRKPQSAASHHRRLPIHRQRTPPARARA